MKSKPCLKIAVWHNLLSGGAKRLLHDHIRGLVALGHQVEVWCPPPNDTDYCSLRSLVKHHITPLEWPQKLHRQKFWRFSTFKSQLIYEQLDAVTKHCRSCAEEINMGDFDVLFANSCSIFYNTPIARFVNIPSLIYLGEPYRWLYEANPELPWSALPDFRLTELFNFRSLNERIRDFVNIASLRVQLREELASARSFNKILVNSFYSRESVFRAYGLDSTVCYPGIDTDYFSPTSTGKKPYVVGIGAIYPPKRIEFVINAISSIDYSSRPSLVWIGNFADDRYRQNLLSLAHSLNVHVEFMVLIPDVEMIRIISRSAVMAYTPRLEPFGLSPLEANACGTAVVALREGGLRETIKHGVNGLLVDALSSTLLGDALSSFTSNLAYAAKAGVMAREYVESEWNLQKAQLGIQRELYALL